MSKGKPDPFLLPLRRALAGEKSSILPVLPPRRGEPFIGYKGTTFNHSLALTLGSAALDRHGPGRDIGLEFLRIQRQYTGHCCDEQDPTSHLAHDLGPICAQLYLSQLENDKEFLDEIVMWLIAQSAIYNMSRSPRTGKIALCGSRCHVIEKVDQRSYASNFMDYLDHQFKRIRPLSNPLLRSSDDLLFLDCLTRIEDAHGRGIKGFESWQKIRLSIISAGPEDLPFLAKRVKYTRNSLGCVSYIMPTVSPDGKERNSKDQKLPPGWSLWAAIDYRTDIDTYGCLPQWGPKYKPTINGEKEIPIPSILSIPGGGENVQVYTSRKEPRKEL